MNDQHRDLIIALTEGSLSEQDAAAASARIAADPELAAEYEIQKTISASFSSVEPVAMTAEERATIRSSLIDQLNLNGVPSLAPIPERSSREAAWWWRPALGLSSVAAVLILGIAVVPGMLGSSDDSGGAEIAAFDTVSEELTADAGGTDMAESGTDGAETTGPAAAAAPLDVPNLRSTDLDEMLDSVAGESAPSDIEEEALKFAAADGTSSILPDDVTACRELLGNALPDGSIQIIGAEQADEGLIVTIAIVADEGTEALARIDVDTCVLVDLAE